MLKFSLNKYRGYLQTMILYDGRSHCVRAHRLVAEAFLPKSEKLTVNHKDGNKQNNKVSNLEWATNREQTAHAIKIGLMSVYSGSKLDFNKAREIRKKYPTEGDLETIGKMYGVSGATISRIIHNKIWKEPQFATAL